MPLVSVCIPTYNRKEYLKETLASVFVQTFRDYEVVVMDDGSTDGTEQMIKDTGFDVRYFWMEHIGKYVARNKLLDLSRGEFLNFLDSDDLLFPDTLERLMKVMDKYGPDVFVYGSHIGVDEKGCEIRTKHRRLPSGFITTELFEYIYVHACGTLCHKRLFKEAGSFDISLRRCAEYKLLLQISLKYKFIPVEGPVFKRRRHQGNVSDRMFFGRKIELDMLEDFYFNSGGKDVIPKSRAMKRLSQEGYRAGRCAVREGMYEEARRLLNQSFHRHPNIKSLIQWSRAILRCC